MLFASTLKRDWTIDDYPINIRFQGVPEPALASRLKPIPWTASVINWPAMSGNGNTKIGALEGLRRNFERFKAANSELPRPGTKVPIGFAIRNRVDQHSELANDFIQRILELKWAWISDESTLGDFHDEETNERLLEKIRRDYGVDVSDISSGNLADIFDRIAKKRAN